MILKPNMILLGGGGGGPQDTATTTASPAIGPGGGGGGLAAYSSGHNVRELAAQAAGWRRWWRFQFGLGASAELRRRRSQRLLGTETNTPCGRPRPDHHPICRDFKENTMKSARVRNDVVVDLFDKLDGQVYPDRMASSCRFPPTEIGFQKR